MPATSRPRRTPCPFGFTIRLTETQRIHFESLAQAQGHASIAAAFKAQALACGMEHPLQEMRLSVDYMTSRMAIRGGRAVECMGFEMGAALTTKDAKPKNQIAAPAPSR